MRPPARSPRARAPPPSASPGGRPSRRSAAGRTSPESDHNRSLIGFVRTDTSRSSVASAVPEERGNCMQVPAPFEYSRASSVDDAIALLERLGPEARLVAGGHSLLPMMKLRLATPEHLVDINPLEAELNYIREEGGQVRIGAMTRHRDILESELLAQRFAIIRDAEEKIADPPVRNRGTIGGALCQADPSEDLSAVCAALGATVVIPGRDGEREIGMDDFHEGPYETAVGDAEMLLEVRIPVRDHGGSAYEKVKRRTGDWATAASGVAIWLDGSTIAAAGI